MKITTIIRCVFFAINVFITWYCIRISTEKTSGVFYISVSLYFLLYSWIVYFLIKMEFKPKRYEIEDAFKIEKSILPSEVAFAMGETYEKQLFTGDVLHAWRQGFLNVNEQGELAYVLSKRGYKSLFNVNPDGLIQKDLSMYKFIKKLSNIRKRNFKSIWMFDVVFSFFIFNLILTYNGEWKGTLFFLGINFMVFIAVSLFIGYLKKTIRKSRSNFLIVLLKLPFKVVHKFIKDTSKDENAILIQIIFIPFVCIATPIFFVMLIIFSFAMSFGFYFLFEATEVQYALANYMWETFQFKNDNMVQFITFFIPVFNIIYVLHLMSTPTKSVTVEGYDLMNSANFMSIYLQQSPKDEKGRLILYPHHIPFAVSLGLKGYRLENLNNREERDLLIEKLFVDRTNSEKIQISSCLSYFINQTQKEK